MNEQDLKQGAEATAADPTVTPAVSAPSSTVAVSSRAVQEVKRQRSLLEGVVRDLRRGVDYGRLPQTGQDSLWGPGAAAIIGAFDAYPGQRRILSLKESEDKISALLEVPVISRASGRVIATGVGAASSLEVRYKYRWLFRVEAEEMGCDDETLAALKTRPGQNGQTQYRIPNPEYWELLNAVVKMGSKRAEVDAAESLPGVASVLRQMFNRQAAPPTGKAKEPQAESPLWSRFWGEVQRLGLTQEEARRKLGVVSMKDWLAQGKSLDHAVEALRQSLAEDENQDLGTGAEGIVPV